MYQNCVNHNNSCIREFIRLINPNLLTPPLYLKLTPMGVSYMKGHHGLTKILMDIPGVDINFQDDNGESDTDLGIL